MELHGETANQASLFGWNTDQGIDNFGELSELHDATNANYAGAAPMVGFGAGAYVIALADRGTPVTPSCGSFASEPALPVDAGAGSTDAGSVNAGDGGSPPVQADGGPIVFADSGLPLTPGSSDAGGAGDADGSALGSSPAGAGGGCGCSASGASGSSESLPPFALLAAMLGTLAVARTLTKRGTL